MSFRLASAGLSFVLVALAVWAQLPLPRKLSGSDEREFNRELQRLRSLLFMANDKGSVELQIANTYAADGRFSEAIRRLKKVVDADLGFDPSRDPDFATLQDTSEFRSIVEQVRRQTPPVRQSRLIATIDERDALPENVAFDTRRNAFLLGSTAKAEILRCAVGAACFALVKPPAGEEGYVLGLKIDRASGAVWATNNTPTGAALRRYDIDTGKLQQTATMEGRHVFNDLALSSTGTVYVTDTREGSIYQLKSGTNTLQRMASKHTFTAANGISISADERRLYVSAWGDGIDVIDLRSKAVKPMAHPDNVCLAFIDGLYATAGTLTAIQNGLMLPRIAQFRLSGDGQEILGMRILERGNPAFDGVTTGVVVGKELYYVANPQTDKKDRAARRPLQVFGVRVAP